MDGTHLRYMAEIHLERVTRESAAAGGAVALAAFRGDLSIDHKDGKTDVVTQADRAAQRAVIDRIREEYPTATIVGEEQGTDEVLPETGLAWIVDPIDGTNNFVRELPGWATSVACLNNGEPVVAVNELPALDDTFVGAPGGVTRNGKQVQVSDRTDPETFLAIPTLWWGRDSRKAYAAATRSLLTNVGDIRRVGSAQIELSAVAAGAVEGVVSNVLAEPWDTVAGAAMIEWAGGTVTDIHGDPWHRDSHGVVASNGTDHELFLEAAREAELA